MHIRRRLAVTATASVLLAAGFATMAQAADPWQPMQRNCSVNPRLIVQNSCNTGSVQAHPTGRYVRIRVYPYSGCQLDWRLRDTVHNQVIKSGRTSGLTTYIYGLSWWYRLEITRVGINCGGDAIINNTTLLSADGLRPADLQKGVPARLSERMRGMILAGCSGR